MIALLAATWVGTARAADPSAADDQELIEELRALRREVALLREQQAGEHGDVTLTSTGDPSKRVGIGDPVVVAPDEQVEEVVAFGSDVEVAGRVDGDAVSFGGDVEVQPTGRVHGDAVSFGGQVRVADGGKVDGDRVALEMPMTLPIATAEPASTGIGTGSLHLATDPPVFFSWLYRRLVWMLSVAGAGVLVIGLFPRRVARIAQDVETRPVRAAVVGTLASGFLSLFSVLFAVLTLGLGSPVSLLLVGLLGIAWLLGFVGLCQAVGDRLPVRERPHGRWLAFFVGVVLLTFLGSLPWVGVLVVGGASVLGIGAALSTRFGRPLA